MKVLVLSVTAGEGHNSISKAVIQQLNEMGIENKMIDILKKDKLRQFISNDLYIYACKHMKKFLTGSYHSLQKRNPMKREHTPVNGMISTVKKEIYRQIEEYQPDVVFCTHIYSARLIGDYRKKFPNRKMKTVSILHDFTVHPYWETVIDLDYLLTPNSAFDATLEYKGYQKKQLVETGLPVASKFSLEGDKKAARRKLGLDENRTTLMVMNGGFGVANNKKLLKQLDEIDADFQIILVNGRNEKSKKEVDALLEKDKISKKVLNLGYSTVVDELMDASDCILGKVGGVSVCEALNKRLPIIVVNEPPAQEYDNMKFLTEQNAAIYIDKRKNFGKILKEYLSDTTKLEPLKENIERLRRPNAARDAAAFMVRLAEENEKERLAEPSR